MTNKNQKVSSNATPVREITLDVTFSRDEEDGNNKPSPCVLCGHEPTLKTCAAWSGIRYQYACSHCTRGGTGLTVDGESANVIWDRINQTV